MQALHTIQQKLKSPKEEYNAYGNYSFRSKESIFEKLKPLLNDLNCTVQFEDELLFFAGEGFFVKSTALLTDQKTKETSKANGYARHAEELKGMQPAQITGATTSYAQKSALEALFLIDGSGNLDAMKPQATTPKKSETEKQPKEEAATKPWLNVGTQQFTDALANLKAGKTTLDQIKANYRISKATESKLK